jgi:hypothetical protein
VAGWSTAAVLVAGGGWLALPSGVVTGTVLTLWLGRLAVTRLTDRQVHPARAGCGAVTIAE